MENKILAGASFENQKFYLEKEFPPLPAAIEKDIRVICVSMAQKLRCTFLMGFHEDGEVYFETVRRKDDFDFDDIGAELEIKELCRREKSLISAISLWYRVVCKKESGEDIL